MRMGRTAQRPIEHKLRYAAFHPAPLGSASPHVAGQIGFFSFRFFRREPPYTVKYIGKGLARLR